MMWTNCMIWKIGGGGGGPGPINFQEGGGGGGGSAPLSPPPPPPPPSLYPPMNGANKRIYCYSICGYYMAIYNQYAHKTWLIQFNK